VLGGPFPSDAAPYQQQINTHQRAIATPESGVPNG
jgi:hypothetical protein